MISREEYKILQAEAARAVAKAVRSGVLPQINGDAIVQCVDCGLPANGYDHRDYRKPLDVEPVCSSCNAYRGPALPWRPPPPQQPTIELGDSPDMLNQVIFALQQLKYSELQRACEAAGVPFNTAIKIRAGATTNPRYRTVQALHDYLGGKK